jgi:malonyl CoA-acyl carrier protein transacylase
MSVNLTPKLLASYLVQPLDFRHTVHALYQIGCRRYIECGGNILTPLVKKNLMQQRDVVVRAALPVNGSIEEAVSCILHTCGSP